MTDDVPSIPENFKTYEEGKHRRYALLFAVNGGAFAVAKMFVQSSSGIVIGELTISQMAIGMALFTVIMTADIFQFGLKMRKYGRDVFAWPGQVVLVLIGTLISTGWLLAAGCVCGCR